MQQLVLPCLLVLVVALCKAVQDTLWHHWGSSPFRHGGEYGYWGRADLVWLRRYIDNRYENGYVPRLKNPVVRMLLIPFWDGWHLMAVVSALAATAIPAASGLPLWSWPALLLFHSVAFETTYTALNRP